MFRITDRNSLLVDCGAFDAALQDPVLVRVDAGVELAGAFIPGAGTAVKLIDQLITPAPAGDKGD